MNDSILKQSVLDELMWDTRVNSSRIGVTASDGSVALSGHVESYPEKYDAIRAVKRVFGVKAIADEIEVHLAPGFRWDDGEIAKRIAHVLEWNVSIPDSNVQAKVHEGVVTLTGEVDWWHQRDHISTQVGHVSGVRSIVNTIALKARATPDDVKKEIEAALTRNSNEEAKHIKVSVSEGTVTLSGKVKAFYERQLVEDAAWAAPGVRNVVDEIRIA